MTFTIDYSTDIGKVRLLIADTDASNTIFQDEQLQAFIDLALDGHVKRAAASALMTMAANENFVQKRIRILDIQTDGPAVAKEMRAQAKMLKDEAAEDEAGEAGGAFDTIELVYNPPSYDERLAKQVQRTS